MAKAKGTETETEVENVVETTGAEGSTESSAEGSSENGGADTETVTPEAPVAAEPEVEEAVAALDQPVADVATLVKDLQKAISINRNPVVAKILTRALETAQQLG